MRVVASILDVIFSDIEGQRPKGGGKGCCAPSVVCEFALAAFENMARNFVGLHLRTMSLWSGGIYVMASLLQPDDGSKEDAKLRAVMLWPRILRLEALLGTDGVPQDILDFDQHFLVRGSPLYREMLSLLAHGHQRAAEDLAWRVFAGIYHEKGLQ